MNETQFCISPVKLLLIKIYGESIWPVNIGIDNDFPRAAVHSCPLDPGRFAPVGPVHVPEGESREAQGLHGNPDTALLRERKAQQRFPKP